MAKKIKSAAPSNRKAARSKADGATLTPRQTASSASRTSATTSRKTPRTAAETLGGGGDAAPARSRAKARLLASKVAFQGRVFSVTTDTVTEPGGVTSTRDVIRHNGSVVVLAVDPAGDASDPTILIERQYRHAAGQFLLELPAGRIEPGEAPLAAAKRELIEETGYRARRWSRFIRYYASPGFLAEHMQVFLAEDIYPGEAHPEPDEKILLTQLRLSALLDQIRAGKIQDGKTILSILLLADRRRAG